MYCNVSMTRDLERIIRVRLNLFYYRVWCNATCCNAPVAYGVTVSQHHMFDATDVALPTHTRLVPF